MSAQAADDTAYDSTMVSELCAARARDVQGLFAGTGVRAWYGRATRNFWAYVPGHAGLVEADEPERLAELIAHTRGAGGPLW
jgi:hypothetical protein